MTDLLWCATLKGAPRTKKTHQQIMKNRSGRPFVVPSKEFLLYQEKCLWQIKTPHRAISEAVNVRCLYYMETRQRVDLTNLLEATDDILVKAGVLGDDCSTIVAAHDGSRVLLDRKNPRVEIEISKLQPEPDPDDKARWILVQTDPYGNSTLDCSKCHTRIFLTNDSRKLCTCPGCGRTMED